MTISLTAEVIISTYIILAFVVHVIVALEYEQRRKYGILPILVVNLVGVCWPTVLLGFVTYRVIDFERKTSFGEFICD